MHPSTVTIKGTRKGLIILLDGNSDLGELKQALTAKLKAAQGFFRGARFMLSSSRPLSLRETAELEEVCLRHGLVPIHEENPPPVPQCEPSPVNQPTLLREVTLRSGQELAVEGNIVLLGHVHRGAIIKATGSIFIIGNLHGVAHAGYLGDETAVILAYRMQPSQLRIAEVIARSPGKAVTPPYPEIARLVAGRITIEPYKAGYTENAGDKLRTLPAPPAGKLRPTGENSLAGWKIGYES